MNLIPVILCGGVGSRLWPVSRDGHPKPFIRLADGQSLLQKAFLRGATLPSAKGILTVTNRELYFKIEAEFREVNVDKLSTSFILEPFGRNTAAAVAAAALHIAAIHGKDTVMLVLAADHLITDQPSFAQAIVHAKNLAQTGKLVTFGIRPSSPETGYGYIEADGNVVHRFVEKPSLEQATGYLATGRYLWNSGIFCFTAGTILQEMTTYCPDILAATRVCVDRSPHTAEHETARLELSAELFQQVPSLSIDYAVMEKSSRVAVVPCDIGWSDIGSWTALGSLTPADAAGNSTHGDVLLHNTHNSYVHGGERIVAVVGAQNLIVVDTPDALLVAEKSCAQDVKHIYGQLKAKNHPAHALHQTVHRPWGTYTVLEEGPRFKIKRIVVKPGASLSLQLHHHRNEHWVVVSGMAKVVNNGAEFFVNTNGSTYIAAGHTHRLSNPGLVDLIIIEVQSGEYLGEDDIVRVDDIYGRVEK